MMKMLLLSLFSISAAFHIGAMRVERPSTCSLNRNRHQLIVVASAPDETVAEEEGEVCADLYGLSKLGCEVKEAIMNAIGGDQEAVDAVTAAINIEEVAEEEDTAENEGTAEEDEAAEAEPAAVDQTTEEDDDATEEVAAEEVAEEASAEEVAEEEVAEEDTDSAAELTEGTATVAEETTDEVIAVDETASTAVEEEGAAAGDDEDA